MSTELLKPPLDRPTIFLESILKNSETCMLLITNREEDKEKKAAILEKAEAEIETFDREETRILLGKSFAVLGDRDDSSVAQNKREAILKILPLVDLRKIDPNELIQDYLREVYKLDGNSGPFGEVDALARAGEAIAYRIRSARNSKKKVREAWNYVASNFVGEEQTYIADKIEDLELQMVLKSSDFYQRVRVLRDEGKSNPEIAERLHSSIEQVKRANLILLKLKESEPKKRSRQRQNSTDTESE